MLTISDPLRTAHRVPRNGSEPGAGRKTKGALDTTNPQPKQPIVGNASAVARATNRPEARFACMLRLHGNCYKA